ncbi:MAG: hypothetical protein KDI63_09605 [Gammaproteobacteria bacterium]|nr:hypothetical protein [Gammaproteobacteria bacterium]
MSEITIENYVKEDKRTIYLKRKALDEAAFIGLQDPAIPLHLRMDHIEPGNWTAVRGRHITHNDVLLYASCGDRNKAHLSDEFAAESPFGEIIAHGMIAVFKQRLLGRRVLPGMGFILTEQEKTFTAPVYVSSSVMDYYEIVIDVDRKKHKVTTLGLSVLNNEYDKIVLKTISTYVPTAIFGSHSESEKKILADIGTLDPSKRVVFDAEGVPNHFSHTFFKKGLWAMLTPDVQMNYVYALAGIGHMKDKLHLSDELTGNMEFLLPCVDDAFRSAVLGTLLPAMGSIYQSETTKFRHPLKLGRLESRVVMDAIEENPRALAMDLSAYSVQKGVLISSSKTKIYFPKPMEESS